MDLLSNALDACSWKEYEDGQSAWVKLDVSQSEQPGYIEIGVTVRRFVLNQYGRTTSPLHSGMPTDRCVAEWLLDTPRTAAIIDGQLLDREPVEERIEIPAAIYDIRRDDVKQALEIQQRVSQQFQDYLRRGLAVVGFERAGETCAYLMGIWK